MGGTAGRGGLVGTGQGTGGAGGLPGKVSVYLLGLK